MKNLKFKNRWYKFERTIETQLSSDYVPDWNLFKAVRESVQNMIDERTLTGTTIHWSQEGKGVYFYDKGTGVDFEDILFLGVSGKRGLENVVGQHGEGEVVSSLVAARLGIGKVMASRDWMVIGRLVEIAGHRILGLDLYKTNKPRKGTCWSYSGGWSEFLEARDSFIQTKRGPRIRILRDEPGQLYTRGMKVNKINDLALGYDLDMTPGRDRGGFTWEQIKNDVKSLLEEYGKKEDFAQILRKATEWWTPKELSLELNIDKEVIKRVSKATSGIVWARQDNGSVIAEAQEQGLQVITMYGSIPQWLTRLPSAEEKSKANYSKTHALPALLQVAVDGFMQALNMSYNVNCVWDMGNARACTNGIDITLSRKATKSMRFREFIGVLAHEISHIQTGAADCSRAHETGTREVLTSLVMAMVNEETRQIMTKAEKAFNQYVDN